MAPGVVRLADDITSIVLISDEVVRQPNDLANLVGRPDDPAEDRLTHSHSARS